MHSQLAAAGTVLAADVLAAIDAPAVDLAAHEKNDSSRAHPYPCEAKVKSLAVKLDMQQIQVGVGEAAHSQCS